MDPHDKSKLSPLDLSAFLESGELSPKKFRGFLKEYEEALGLRYEGIALAMNNGTAAIFSAISALDLADDEEVIFPVYGWHACVSPMKLLSGRVVFCPVNEEDLTLDVKILPSLITKKTRAIFCLHLYGNPCDMGTIMEIAEEYDLRIIEDCSHAYGGMWKGKALGTFGDFACFSTQQSKLLSTGEGGFIVVRNEMSLKKIKERFLPGRDGEFESLLKFRPHGMSVWLGLKGLRDIESAYAERKKIFEEFRDLVREISWVRIPGLARHTHERAHFEGRLVLDSTVSRAEILKKLDPGTFTADDYHFLPAKLGVVEGDWTRTKNLLNQIINVKLTGDFRQKLKALSVLRVH